MRGRIVLGLAPTPQVTPPAGGSPPVVVPRIQEDGVARIWEDGTVRNQ